MFESEIYRLKGKNVKISEMYTVYCEYIEKARRFIQERGNSNFAEGSEANAVKRMWEMYGAVPNLVFTQACWMDVNTILMKQCSMR